MYKGLPPTDQTEIRPCGFFLSSAFELGEAILSCLILTEIAHRNLSSFSGTRQMNWHRYPLSCCASISFAFLKTIVQCVSRGEVCQREGKGKRNSRVDFLHASFNDFGKPSTWIKC